MTDSSAVLFLTKLAPVFLYPIGLVILLTIAGMIVIPFRRRPGLFLLALAAAWLWVASMPAFAAFAVATLERQYPPVAAEAAPKADVAIVLTGGIGPAAAPRTDPDLKDESDRVLHAARLYRAGRVGRILVTGGFLPWVPQGRPEAELTRSLLVDWGIPAEAVAIAGESRNTYENALEIEAMRREAPFDTALLVTSAYHMPRAMAVFRKAGLPVTAAATDIIALDDVPATPLRWLPSASALAVTTLTIREWLGYAAYRLRGYL
ncbi:MAG: YdcF family protein [Alphaproteobacteria bacterium]